jgi:hypothetical protein
MTASPIRDSAGKLAITPGVWELSKSGMNVDRPTFKSEAYCGGASFLSACSHQWKRKADAALIAEAGTVTNQTGRTPAELAALVRELREAAFAVYDMPTECGCEIGNDALALWDKLESAIAKSEGV